MKSIANFGLVTILLVGAVSLPLRAQTTANDQPLGDYARSVKKEKNQAAKSFDNDNLPTQDKLSVVGNAASQTTDAQSGQASQEVQESGDEVIQGKPPAPGKHAAPVDNAAINPGDSAEDRQKVVDKWQDKLGGQKDKVDMLSREIDVLQREYKLRVADMYSDAGSRLRNQANWDKQEAEFKQKLDDKQKALTDAKQDMENMQEDARKSGVPTSVVDNAQDTGGAQNPQK